MEKYGCVKFRAVYAKDVIVFAYIQLSLHYLLSITSIPYSREEHEVQAGYAHVDIIPQICDLFMVGCRERLNRASGNMANLLLP